MLSAERERGGGEKGFSAWKSLQGRETLVGKRPGRGGVDLNSKGEKGGIPAQEVEEPRGD